MERIEMRASSTTSERLLYHTIQFVRREFGLSEAAIARVLEAEPQLARDNLQYALWMHGAINAQQLARLNQWLSTQFVMVS